MNQKLAAEIASRMLAASQLCDASVKPVKANEALGIAKVYGRLAGQFMGHAYANVLAPIWKAHPALTPPEMNEPYVTPTPSLSEESQASIRAFVAEARAVLEFMKKSLNEDDATRTLEYGGLAELEESLLNIEEFLARPRFRDAAAEEKSPEPDSQP